MKIGFDARKVRDFGIGRYIQGLLTELLNNDRENTYYIYLPPNSGDLFPVEGKNAVIIEESSPGYSIREHLWLSAKAARHGLDLFHSPHYVVPRFLPCKFVVTIHDLIHLLYPVPKPFNAAFIYARMVMGYAARRSCRIFTDSENTKTDLMKTFPVDAEKITVTPMGVDALFSPLEDQENLIQFLKSRDLPESYILYVGNRKRHKNIDRMLRAYARIPGEVQCPLVFSGNVEDGDVDLRELISTLNLKGKVFFSGPVANKDLRYLYAGARFLIFPSLYEGFGLPPLEAMACGIPVVVSHKSSLPEVVGDAGLYVDPLDEGSMVEAMVKMLSDSRLASEFREKGLNRSREFRWHTTGEKTLQVYQEIFSH